MRNEALFAMHPRISNDFIVCICRLKNKLQYGSQSPEQQSHSLAKIQHLESLVFDLEASERKLQRQVAELLEEEAELRDRLQTASLDGRRLNGWKSIVDREKHIDLLQQVSIHLYDSAFVPPTMMLLYLADPDPEILGGRPQAAPT